MGSLRSFGRRLAIGGALGLVLIGVPIMSIRLVGWPLPTYVPDPGDVLLAVQQGNIPSTFVVKALAAVLWVVWAQFAWATVWEIAVNVRRSERGERSTRAPLVGRAVQNGVARLVTSLFTAGVVAAPTVAPLLSTGPVAAYSAPLLTSAAAAPSLESQSSVRGESRPAWHVQEGDTLWAIAEVALGDGSRVGEILELNPSLGSARALRPGTTLVLPGGATVPADRAAPSAVPAVVGFVPAAEVTIVRGDTLWDLSEDRLEVAYGEEPSAGATVAYLRTVIGANPNVVEDPNLIYPGEVFAFPAIGEAPTPVFDAPDPVPTPRSEPVATPASDATPPTSTSALPADAGRRDTPPPTTQANSSETREPWTDRWQVTAAVSTLLAGSLFASVRRVRLRRAARSASKSPTLDQLVGAESVLQRRANIPFTDWLAARLAEVAAHVASTGFDGHPVAIELGDDEAELLWDRPNHTALAPWSVEADGWSWSIRFDLDDDLEESEIARAMPALVTVGRREGRDLILDLEAFGTLRFTGDPDLVGDLVRSMAVELGGGEGLANAQVVLVGFDLALDEHLSRVVSKTDAAALAYLTTLVQQHRLVVERSSAETLLQLRGASPMAREATIFVLDTERCGRVEEMCELVEPLMPVSLVVIGSKSAEGAVIEVASSDRAKLSPLGVEFAPAGLKARAAEVLADQLDELEADGEPDEEVAMLPGLIEPAQAVIAAVEQVLQGADVAPVEPELHPEEAAPHREAPRVESGTDDGAFGQLVLVPEGSNGEHPEEGVQGKPSGPGDRLMIRVLGAPRVECPAALGQRDVSLLAFVACNGGSATDDQVIDAVWGGKALEKPSFYNRLSRIRSALGGVLTSRDKHDPLVRVEGVVTDLALMTDLIARSAEESSGDELQMLLEALSWIEGRPFDAAGYEWAFTHQFHSQTSELIESAALRAVELALDAADFDAAATAISQGLKALPLQEPLYRAKMRLAAESNNMAGVRETYEELVLLLDDLDDGYRPSSETDRLLLELSAGRKSA